VSCPGAPGAEPQSDLTLRYQQIGHHKMLKKKAPLHSECARPPEQTGSSSASTSPQRVRHLHAVDDDFVRTCQRDWQLALRLPHGLFPNCPIDVHAWGGRRAELQEATR